MMVTLEVGRMDSLFICIFALVLVDKGESLKCYNCHTQEHPNCTDISSSDEFKATTCNYKTMPDDIKGSFGIHNIEDTSLLRFACIRYDVSDGKDKYVVVRACSLAKRRSFDPCQFYENRVEIANTITKLSNKVVHCSLCDTDNCNGAVPTATSTSTKFSCILAISIMCSAFTSWLGV